MRNRIIIVIWILLLTGALFLYYYSSIYIKRSDYNSYDYRHEFSSEIVLVYVGSSTCPICKKKQVPNFVKKIKEVMLFYADSLDYGFKSIGVSQDFDIEKGIEHLNLIGKFDEISTGNGYSNAMIQKYIWEAQNHASDTGTPQVILVKRDYQIDRMTQEPLFTLENEAILKRGIGILGLYDLLITVKEIDIK